MAFLGTLHLASSRLRRHPLGLPLFLAAAGLGPGLTLLASISPIQDGGGATAPAWLQLLALSTASLATWALGGCPAWRRTTHRQAAHVENAALITGATALVLATAAVSLSSAGQKFPPTLLLLMPLKLGAIAALVLARVPGRNTTAIAWLWILTLGAPQVLPPSLAGLIGVSTDPAPLAQALAALGLLLVGQGIAAPHSIATGPPPPSQAQAHALRRPR